MSFKLQDKIQGTPGLPGKHKRLLVAMAKRSRNDGTNVFASKETLGDLAGVSERTAFRIIDELVEASAVVKAESHQCSVKTCPKGSRHYPAPGNHWTQAYNINVEGLEEAAAKLRDFSEHRGESRKPRAARRTEWHDILSLQPYGEWYDILSVSGVTFCQQSGMPFWQANPGLQDNPVPLGSKDSSALTSGVRERVSSPPSLAPASPEDRGGRFPNPTPREVRGVDYRNNAIMVRVCDGCYDGAYEAWKNYPSTRANLLDMRPGYKPPKFDTSAVTPELAKALAAWFKENGKIGEWKTTKEDHKALGVDAERLTGVLRYLQKNNKKVTREQFVILLMECAAERPEAAEPEPMAMDGGDVL